MRKTPNMDEQITLLILYEGDITELLKASGSRCPFRLTGDGDTEQSVELTRGMAGINIPIEEFTQEAAPFILDDAKRNGRIKSHRWIIAQRP